MTDEAPGGRCPDCGAHVEPGHEVCGECGVVFHEARKGGALAVLGNRAAWLLGAVYLLAGAAFALGEPPAMAAGVAFAAGGIYLLPPARRAVADAYGVRFARWQVVLIAVGVFFVGWGLLPASAPDLGRTVGVRL